jgi:hypothetical protein
MKLLIPCNQCNQTYVDVEITDDGVYHLSCANGHDSIVFLQQQQFEVLFEMGIMALLDGYNREAVTSFAASLERFHEFCIRMILAQNTIDLNKVNETWKSVSQQSERQLGAFYFLYLSQFKTVPPVIENKRVKFRNDVIHKGHFPKHKEVMDYGKYLYNYFIEQLKNFYQNCWNGYGLVATSNQVEYFAKHPFEIGKVSVYSKSSIFSYLDTNWLNNPYTFEESLEKVQADKARMFKK